MTKSAMRIRVKLMRTNERTNEPLTPGMRVRCHKNLHNGMWAVTQKGKVIAYVTEVALSDVTFVYYETLRLKCVAMKRRKVCAWAQGVIADVPKGGRTARLCYNPFRAATFTTERGAALTHCESVEFAADGKAYVAGGMR